MLCANVVRLIVEYLSHSSVDGTRATLTGVLWYVDSRAKTLPSPEEVNAALAEFPAIRVERESGHVVFGNDGAGSSVNSEDMKLADRQYRREFSAALKKLRAADA